MNRRRFLASISGVTALGLSGCVTVTRPVPIEFTMFNFTDQAHEVEFELLEHESRFSSGFTLPAEYDEYVDIIEERHDIRANNEYTFRIELTVDGGTVDVPLCRVECAHEDDSVWFGLDLKSYGSDYFRVEKLEDGCRSPAGVGFRIG
ncbi:hypothetical protein HAPAU_11820 [Halalkalicoccus paucihalophilus]|uniref:Lipoprotein n=1 Tax=Halalkalicoccus paucihalophilus TaxID=1008153 RepID=A0A151AEU0_9EURY|nr:hypothetical protein HAPAU_11820 [Halalkalicoccus paucihalophilus]